MFGYVRIRESIWCGHNTLVDCDNGDIIDNKIRRTFLACVYRREIVTTQSRAKPEVGPSHNDVIWQLNGILTAHLNLASRFERQQRQVHKSNFTHGTSPWRDWTSQRVRLSAPGPPAVLLSWGGCRRRRRQNTRVGRNTYVTAAELNSLSTFSISFEIKWKRLTSNTEKEAPADLRLPSGCKLTKVWGGVGRRGVQPSVTLAAQLISASIAWELHCSQLSTIFRNTTKCHSQSTDFTLSVEEV